MKNFLERISAAISILLIASTGYAYGGSNYNIPEPADCDDCISCQPDCCSRGGFLSADLLYWRPFVGGVDKCSSNVSDELTPDGRVISRFHGKVRNPDFNWDPGFRVGAGYAFACNNWDVGVFYTHFDSNTSRGRSRGNHSNSSSSSFKNFTSYGPANRERRIRWNINFNVIDLVAGYQANAGSCFTFRPFIGLRGARIDQKLHRGHFPIDSSGYFSSNRHDHFGIKNHEKFTGIGPLLGIEADWPIGCGFKLYASAATSWLYGKFRVRQDEFDRFAYLDDFARISKNLDTDLANFDAGFGIRWETCFCGDWHLALQLGLEHHQYFNYNRLGEYGDLSFDGANFSVAIGF